MRLSKRIERAEASAAASRLRADSRGSPIGIVWTSEEQRVERMAQRGERIVTDLHLTSDAGDGAHYARSVERFTRDAADLGCIYDAAGVLVGRVVSDEKGLIRWEAVSGLASETAGH